MAWECYKLVYQAKSPIHIGWHTLGYIKRTRYYITGKAMWGAMTANFTRASKEKEIQAYEKYGTLLRTDILASYFYPALEPAVPLLPEFTDNGLKYGIYTASEFERLFIRSYGQTAVLPASNTAEDESLHESEFIAPIAEDKQIKEQNPVYFVGYVFVRNNAKTGNGQSVGWNDKDIRLKEIISELFVGGDRKYGWGRLQLDKEKTCPEKNTFFGHTLDLNKLEIEVHEDSPIPAHLSVNCGAKMKGDLEPLVGRNWGIIDKPGEKKMGFGQVISEAKLCWAPGSVVEEDKTLKIEKYGILAS